MFFFKFFNFFHFLLYMVNTEKTLKELIKYASDLGVKKISKLNKADIIDKIIEKEKYYQHMLNNPEIIHIDKLTKEELEQVAKDLNIVTRRLNKDELINKIKDRNRIYKIYDIQETKLNETSIDTAKVSELKKMIPNSVRGKSKCLNKEELKTYAKHNYIDKTLDEQLWEKIINKSPLESYSDELLELRAYHKCLKHVTGKSREELIKELYKLENE